MKLSKLFGGVLLLLISCMEYSQPLCVLESDFGFKINCAFKKSGLFRVRNLGGIKAHASLGFSLGDELGFEQSLTNLDPSRRRSVSVKSGAPPNLVANAPSISNAKHEKRGKQNRIMTRPMTPMGRPNQSAMDRLTTLHKKPATMQPIIVQPTIEIPSRPVPTVTMAKPMPMGVPPFKPLPPKEETLKVIPIIASKKYHTPLQVPESKGPALAYPSENYQSHNQISKMVSQMTAVQYSQPQLLKFTPTSIHTPLYSVPTTLNPFVPMPIATQPVHVVAAPVFKQMPNAYMSIQNNPVSNFVDQVPHQIHDIASYNTKKVDDYNTITGYGDDTTLQFNKDDINSKIAEIAKAGNISMEAVEAAIALRQQQLLNKYANIPLPEVSTTTTTESPAVFPTVLEPEPEIIVASPPQKPKRVPTSGKVMNAPREYYPVGYEKNFDDHFQSKVDLPETSFHCGDQKYFPGLYGDESLGCMVFHVCALTDDGLVMKSFLCPESTLFDQTILKCNWWFYVDCKNTQKLYETNIPVSKSYQLMKALTFFSSYKKEMEDGRQANPEDLEGVKEAITILQNQDSSKSPHTVAGSNTVQIITPLPYIDERTNQKTEYSTSPSPVYRSNRNYDFSKDTNNTKTNHTNEEVPKSNKLIKVNTSFSIANENTTSNATTIKVEGTNSTEDSSRERKHRRRMVLKNNNSTRLSTTSEETTSTLKTIEQDTPSQKDRKELLTDLLQELNIDPNTLNNNLPAVKRQTRSSAEVEKEMAIVNNEKVQIVRPTVETKLVGEHETPTATIEKLDEAILGKPKSLRFKKDTIAIVTPQRLKENPNQT